MNFSYIDEKQRKEAPRRVVLSIITNHQLRDSRSRFTNSTKPAPAQTEHCYKIDAQPIITNTMPHAPDM